MTLAEVGRAGQRVDPLSGGDVAADGSLLSVAQIQQRFREERARRDAAPSSVIRQQPAEKALAGSRGTTPSPAKWSRGAVTADAPEPAPLPDLDADQAAGPTLHESATSETSSEATGLALPPGWVRVIAGHSGAGSSTVALALADAAAATGRRVHLVEPAHPSRSGLLAASSAELGLDTSGAWRRGTRGQPALLGQVIIIRRAGETPPPTWPVDDDAAATESNAATSEQRDRMVAVDLGLVPIDAVARVAVAGSRTVIAARPTIPGVRLVEQLLDRLDVNQVVIAMLGPRRWPGEVMSSCGPRIRTLREQGRVVAMPLDRRLELTGPTHAVLPKTVLAAGRQLLDVLSGLGSSGATY